MSDLLTSPPVPTPYTSATVFGSKSNTPNLYPNASTSYFFGFSTIDTEKTGETKLYDIQLINRDLLNYFYTRVGERVMRPDFGCLIWEWLMDPMTPLLNDQIVAECQRIVSSDSRLTLLDTQVYTYENGIRVELTLLYAPWNVVNSFTATFEQRQTNYFSADSEY